jgi:uncharacterized protein YbjT (DUF2867 family)
VADIGAFVAAVIERGDTVFGRRFDIAGDELTGEEAAAILSKVTGREVHYEGFPPDVLRAQSEDMARMFEWFDSSGYAADIKSLRRDFPEVKGILSRSGRASRTGMFSIKARAKAAPACSNDRARV